MTSFGPLRESVLLLTFVTNDKSKSLSGLSGSRTYIVIQNHQEAQTIHSRIIIDGASVTMPPRLERKQNLYCNTK